MIVIRIGGKQAPLSALLAVVQASEGAERFLLVKGKE
jgi:hypothetical protein